MSYCWYTWKHELASATDSLRNWRVLTPSPRSGASPCLGSSEAVFVRHRYGNAQLSSSHWPVLSGVVGLSPTRRLSLFLLLPGPCLSFSFFFFFSFSVVVFSFHSLHTTKLYHFIHTAPRITFETSFPSHHSLSIY